MKMLKKKSAMSAILISGSLHLFIIAIIAGVASIQMRGEHMSQIVTLVSEGEMRITSKRVSSGPSTGSIEPSVQAPSALTRQQMVQPISSAIQRPSPVNQHSLIAGSNISMPKAAAPPLSSGPVDVRFGEADGPRWLHKAEPVYPTAARRMNREGRVLLRLSIDETGKMINLEVLERAPFGFTEAAIDAVRSSTYIAARRGGMTVASRALLTVRFELER